MTTRIPILVLLLAVTHAAAAADTVVERQSWTKTYPVSGTAPRLHVSNIWGSVQVRTGRADEIRLTVDEVRSAPDQQLFDLSLQRLPLTIDADGSGVSINVGVRDNWPDNRWTHHEECHECRVDYQFVIDAPPGTVVDVGTVMDGTVEVNGITGNVSASNVNGVINIRDIQNCDNVSSVNGAIRMGFTRAPAQDCRIETINGDITLDMPSDSGFDLALDLFNGEVSSELPVRRFSPPATIEQVEDDGRKKYRIQQQAGLRIGAGGPVYSISSINGDVRVKRAR